MNYHQTYDPMQASAMRQQQNSQLAGSIKGGLSSIQAGLQENAQWKKFKAESKAETDAKARLWEAASASLQESGLTEKQIPALANMPAALANEKISSEQFATQLATILEPVKETILTRKVVSEGTPEYRGERQPTGVSPMEPSAMAPASATAQGSPTDTLTARLMQEQATGTYDPMVDSVTAPYKLDAPGVGDQHIAHSKTTVNLARELASRGMLKSGDAIKIQDVLARNEENASKERQNEQKIRLAEIKAAAEKERDRKDKLGKQTVDASSTNEILSRATGKATAFSSAEVAENPDNYLIGDRKYNPNSGGGINSPSLNPINLRFKFNAAVAKSLYDKAADKSKWQAIPDVTPEGEPYIKYVPSPDAIDFQIINDTRPDGLFNRYGAQILPEAAARLGMKFSQATPALGGGYNK